MRRNRRGFSIRARILTLLLAPLLPLLGMWAFSTTETLGTALNLVDANTNIDKAGEPVNRVIEALQQERKLSLLYVSEQEHAGGALTDQRKATDDAVSEFRRLTNSSDLQSAANPVTRQYLTLTNTALDGLSEGRTAIDRGLYDRSLAMNFYNGIIDTGFGLYGSISGVDDQKLARQAQTVIDLTSAREYLNREDALLGGVLTAGTMTVADHVALTQTIGVQRAMYEQAARYLSEADLTTYNEIQKNNSFLQLRAIEDKVAAARAGGVAPVDPTEWKKAFGDVNTALNDLESGAADATKKATLPAAYGTFIRLGLAGGLGLLLITGLIIVSYRIARSLIKRIADLRRDALDLADNRLPEIVTQLRRGEQIDLNSVAPLQHGEDELGQLADAFTEVQRTAIVSAMTEAELRAGLNQVFLNISRRSQTLLHRQLALLDKMERRTTDADDLSELFKIDHLATRMRRHAEDLVILAGASPGRGWRNPVPLADICRAAVSEVEDYARVVVRSLPEVSLAGRAVSDVVHLLAELLENATAFSPQETQVHLSGQLVPNGFAVEIEDRGLGMPLDAIDAANRHLISPPDFDPGNSSRLGLFVVARLAARHGIRVTLRPSPYGGVSAITLIPGDLIVKQPALPGTVPVSPAPRTQPSSSGTYSSAPAMAVASAPASSPVIASSPVVTSTTAPVVPTYSVPPPRTPSPANGNGRPTVALTEDGLPIRQRPAARAEEPSLWPPTRDDSTPPRGMPVTSVSSTPYGPGGPGTSRTYDATAQLSGGVGSAEPAAPPRAPEEMRSMYSSFQSGTLRGRRDAAITGGTPPNGVPIIDPPASDSTRTNGKASRAAAPEDVVVPIEDVKAETAKESKGKASKAGTAPAGTGGADVEANAPETKKRQERQ